MRNNSSSSSGSSGSSSGRSGGSSNSKNIARSKGRNMGKEQIEDGKLNARERIMLAAIDEFALNGYKAASTNSIVQRAGVSKGLLFSYYGNKETLHLECSQYVIEKVTHYIIEKLSFSDDDIFNRFRHILEIKMRFFSEYTSFANFAYGLWNSELRSAFKDRINEYLKDAHNGVNIMSLTCKNADLTKLNDGIDIYKILDYMEALLDAFWRRFSAKYDQDPQKITDNLDEYFTEADNILAVLRNGAYKPTRRHDA